MEPHYEDDTVTLHHGDCLEVLRTLPDASVDAVVTDPPYGLEFMGKGWDAPWAESDVNADAGFHGGGISQTKRLPSFTGSTNPKCLDCKGTRRGRRDGTAKVAVCLCENGGRFPNTRAVEMRAFGEWCELWTAECLRVLKPGGHLLAFGGTRTWHRLACAVEDAGFEVRDSIAWLYGSGFPKSLDVSKAIDKARDDKGDVHSVTSRLADLAHAAGITRADVDEHMQTSDMGGWWLSRLPHRCACPSVENWTRLRDFVPGAHELDAEVWRLNGRKGTPGEAWDLRPITQAEVRPLVSGEHISFDQRSSTERERRDIPATPDAERWQGWGTALKPAFEPVVVARKPLAGTVAANVLEHGTGALNIDGCRVEAGQDYRDKCASVVGLGSNTEGDAYGAYTRPREDSASPAGRWPTNVVLDDTQAAELDEQSGESVSKAGGSSGTHFSAGGPGVPTPDRPRGGHDDSGGASRFFPTFRYEAKAPASERPKVNGVAHATVKPLDLMRWLVRLVTPPGGTVLEPFAGSGTTVEACVVEGFKCVAIEKTDEYLPLITQRINRQRDPVAYMRAAGDDLGLFDL